MFCQNIHFFLLYFSSFIELRPALHNVHIKQMLNSAPAGNRWWRTPFMQGSIVKYWAPSVCIFSPALLPHQLTVVVPPESLVFGPVRIKHMELWEIQNTVSQWTNGQLLCREWLDVLHLCGTWDKGDQPVKKWKCQPITHKKCTPVIQSSHSHLLDVLNLLVIRLLSKSGLWVGLQVLFIIDYLNL